MPVNFSTLTGLPNRASRGQFVRNRTAELQRTVRRDKIGAFANPQSYKFAFLQVSPIHR
jgi:hypothetical protein